MIYKCTYRGLCQFAKYIMAAESRVPAEWTDVIITFLFNIKARV
jgi:hypothetical protein